LTAEKYVAIGMPLLACTTELLEDMLREVTRSLVALRSDLTMAGYKVLPVRQSCTIITHKTTTRQLAHHQLKSRV
jgi:hypothetical protein